MANKIVDIDGIGQVTLVRRRGSRHVRIGFTRDGSVRVSLPAWAPYKMATDFVASKHDWITKNRPEQAGISLEDGDKIGKAHRLKFSVSYNAKQASVRVGSGVVAVSCPVNTPSTAVAVQKAAQRGALKALKTEADQLLPQRLRDLAAKHGFDYKSVDTKRLSSRWGSCTQHREITLNIYLMQLPWHLIDYVIIHELCHTEHLNHSASFWERVEQALPDARDRRKQLKTYKTLVFAVK